MERAEWKVIVPGGEDLEDSSGVLVSIIRWWTWILGWCLG